MNCNRHEIPRNRITIFAIGIYLGLDLRQKSFELF